LLAQGRDVFVEREPHWLFSVAGHGAHGEPVAGVLAGGPRPALFGAKAPATDGARRKTPPLVRVRVEPLVQLVADLAVGAAGVVVASLRLSCGRHADGARTRCAAELSAASVGVVEVAVVALHGPVIYGQDRSGVFAAVFLSGGLSGPIARGISARIALTAGAAIFLSGRVSVVAALSA
jgi:hypothetical protein